MPSLRFETPAIPLTLGQADKMLGLLIGASFRGLSQSPDEVLVHYDGTLTTDQTAAALTVLSTMVYGLTVVTNRSYLAADDTDTATITVSGSVMASDAQVSYWVYFTGSAVGEQYEESLWASGTATVTSGTATLTFKTPTAGRYHIVVKRTNALHIGRVEILAT
jgi:hypothetical protein